MKRGVALDSTVDEAHYRRVMVWSVNILVVLTLLLFAWPVGAEEVRSLGSSIELRDLVVSADHRYEDAQGVKLDFRYRVGRVNTEKALYLVAHVSEEGGAKVGSLSTSAVFRDREGFLHGKKQLLTVPRNRWREGSIFIPYYAMKLAPGSHRIRLEFDAVSDVGSCKTGERPRRIRVRGENEATVSITKPPYKMVQLLVQRIDVAQVPTDTALLLRWKVRPDLQWRLRVRAGAGGVVHTSDTRDNSYSGRWKQYSPAFPLSHGDRLSIIVQDEDFMGDDELGVMKVTLNDLLSHDSSSLPLKGGSVRSLVLGPVKAH